MKAKISSQEMQSSQEKGWNTLMCEFTMSGASPQGWMFLQISHAQTVLGRFVSSLSIFSSKSQLEEE
jgi:hypothetical protein